jgi:hypothetical protein
MSDPSPPAAPKKLNPLAAEWVPGTPYAVQPPYQESVVTGRDDDAFWLLHK